MKTFAFLALAALLHGARAQCETEDAAMETCMDNAGLGGGAKVVCVSLRIQVSVSSCLTDAFLY